MSLSLSPSAATPPAREATARQDRAAPVGAAAAGGHDPASHGHAGAAHAPHAHADSPADRRPPVRIGASVLRMSLAGRLALVSALIIVLWGAVLLVTGGGA
ncbi:hypothetical protein FHT36_000797 [Xanthobacter sp. SG618]|uniref:hypothetical protein n=1 Tax=Xanthobacter sp. SG618 TaxID=2587121 RepID=UPI001821B5E2|nr:hypothetical protein [Xanthobacter sp. SG618]NMN56919.1 hypothetical protein [Xanthobacter sp. SG618]